MLFPALVALAASASLAEAAEWWQTGPIYQIYPASFQDSDGDGIGDIAGITSRVHELSQLGVEAVWLSPIFDSPMRDNGYDISNYTKINPIFGNITDVETLIETLHKKGIKIMLDMVPNHTSNDSQWFQDSINKVNGKDDWYVWKEPKGYDLQSNPLPPNNWISIFGGPAWTFNEKRNQFYLHQFGVFQPDLNYENPEVLKEMKDILRFWLTRGVDGFRVDAVPFLAESNYNSNEPNIAYCTPTDSYSCLDHIYTMDQNLTYQVLEEFAAVLQEKNLTNSTTPKVQFVEAYTTPENTMKYYANGSMPFNFLMIVDVHKFTNASQLEQLIQGYLKGLPEKAWPNWVAGNHDNSRIGTRMGEDLIDAMNMLVQLLPGTPVTYYGEELGMTDTLVRPDQYQDHNIPNRDPERTPYQWNTETNADFTRGNAQPYLPINPNYWEINLATESKTSPSHLSIYKELVALNKKMADQTSNKLDTAVLNEWVFAFHRANHLVVINLNNEQETFALKDFNLTIGSSASVAITSLNSITLKTSGSLSSSDVITLFPRSGVVFTTSSAESIYQTVGLIAISFLLTLRRP